MQIRHYELRYTGAPHGVNPVTDTLEYSVLATTTRIYVAERWLREMGRENVRTQGVYAIDEQGEAYPCAREQGIGPIGIETDAGFERIRQ